MLELLSPDRAQLFHSAAVILNLRSVMCECLFEPSDSSCCINAALGLFLVDICLGFGSLLSSGRSCWLIYSSSK